MTKQRLEQHLQEVLKDAPGTFYMKLQVNPIAHCRTVADYLFLTPKNNFVIECKECNGTAYSFNRYTQKPLMEKFSDSIIRNRSFLVICFWKGSRKKSAYYPIEDWIFDSIMRNSKKKSANEKDLKQYKISWEELKELRWLN
jgi:hypothetical protein